MDPNAILEELRNCLALSDDIEGARAALCDLEYWLKTGGFQPTMTNGFLICLLRAYSDCQIERIERKIEKTARKCGKS